MGLRKQRHAVQPRTELLTDQGEMADHSRDTAEEPKGHSDYEDDYIV